MTPTAKLLLMGVLAPFVALLEVLWSPVQEARGKMHTNAPRKILCASCDVTDYPRADYETHGLFCRHCGHEHRWWL